MPGEALYVVRIHCSMRLYDVWGYFTLELYFGIRRVTASTKVMHINKGTAGPSVAGTAGRPQDTSIHDRVVAKKAKIN